jgi:hypothetical protein
MDEGSGFGFRPDAGERSWSAVARGARVVRVTEPAAKDVPPLPDVDVTVTLPAVLVD